MGYRKYLHLELIRELLGPRNGACESMESDPRDEYAVGILEPKNYTRGGVEDYSGLDLKEEVPADKGSEGGSGVFEEDDADTLDLDQPNAFSGLDPRALPKSMGISFVVATSEKPLITVCFTWARYLKEDGKWKRYPKNFMLFDYDVRSRLIKEPERGTSIRIRSTEIDNARWHVSIHIVNTSEDFENSPESRHLIFQPQIRVKLPPNVSAAPLPECSVKGEDDKRLFLLYRKMPALARGHMCSAVWEDVDPERPFEGKICDELVPEDIKLLDQRCHNIFTNPTIRSEYLPAYSVVQSVIEADKLVGMENDDLHSGTLSEKWNPAGVIAGLHKITVAYENWILNQKKAAEAVRSLDRDMAFKNISLCEFSLSRIKEGITLLESNEDAMLAFCFMNRAMCMQSEWARKKPLIWRPFQMSFILQCIRGIVDEDHTDRSLCDLLWFPTGGGKTEAYLGLMIFTLSYLRRKQKFWDERGLSSSGTAVISRYTLRLLTIQQFRRALKAITACEVLRIKNWKPAGYDTGAFLWGKRRFSIGLWIGGGVTPNSILDHKAWDNEQKVALTFLGAISKLAYTHEKGRPYERIEGEGEPAQVLECPVCSSTLAVPKSEGEVSAVASEKGCLYWTVSADKKPEPDISRMSNERFKVSDIKIHDLPRRDHYIVEMHFTSASTRLTDSTVNDWCNSTVLKVLGAKLKCASGSRPGYFVKRLKDVHKTPIDFEIRCPNPTCELNKYEWFESNLQNTENLTPVAEPFELPSKPNHSKGIPIPAFTVDAQVYSKCPSVILATVDKFARLPFEPRCASIFGNVNRYDEYFGYYREGTMPDTGGDERLAKAIHGKPTIPFLPPQLIIQDELHLIEGPLGSLVGLYELDVMKKIAS